jgi:hypothetical protein
MIITMGSRSPIRSRAWKACGSMIKGNHQTNPKLLFKLLPAKLGGDDVSPEPLSNPHHVRGT